MRSKRHVSPNKRLQSAVAPTAAAAVLLALTVFRGVDAGPHFQPAATVTSVDGKATQSGRSQTQIGEPQWFHDPIGRMAYVFRLSRRLDSAYERNIAIAFIDVTGLDGLDTRGYEVVDVSSLRTENPALYQELGLEGRSGVRKIAIIPESNEASPSGDQQRNHSEMKLIIQDLAYLSPQDGGESITPDRIFALYSDRSPCDGCAQYVPRNTDVFYATAAGSGSSAAMQQLISTAKAQAKVEGGDTVDKEVAAQEALSAERAQAESSRRTALAKVKDGYARGVARLSLFRQSSGQCGGQALGAHSVKMDSSTVALAADIEAQAAPCSGDAGTDNTATADSGLVQALSEPEAQAPGGIDFSSLQLRYLADPGDGSGLQYAFQAPLSTTGTRSPSAGMDAAKISSDAFFVWLELDPSTFWVNLNPTEPDRIVDARMGRTDVGRIMLQADLQLKKDVGTLIHPDTAVGDSFWSQLSGDCFSSRVWVVPSPAQVHTDGDKLYILSAPLDVKMEADYIQMPAGSTSKASCPQQDTATRTRNETLYRSVVLPKLVDRVNNDPAYADLRRVYLARVAAEWYRNLSATQHTTYAQLINHGDIDPWTTKTTWKPTDTFQQYVTSYTKGEFNVTHSATKGGYEYTYTYTYGGVDLTSVPLKNVNDATFAADEAGLANDITDSLASPTATGNGVIWFGSPTPFQASGAHPSKSGSPASRSVPHLIPWLLLPFAALVWRRSRRTRKANSGRKGPSGRSTW